MTIEKIKKYMMILAGSICLVLGAVGIFIPVLPTTPFLLLASFLYLRSSKRLYNWLLNHKILGMYIYNYITYKAIPKSTKICALVFLWLTLSISMILLPSLPFRILLAVIGICVSIHLISLKTLVPEEAAIAETDHT